MRYLLIGAYLLGWIVTSVALMRAMGPADDGNGAGRGRRAVLALVNGACAILLAAVWPLSGMFLPLIRAAFNRGD